MDDKERLEEIKKFGLANLLEEEFNWLIEQAEKKQEFVNYAMKEHINNLQLRSEKAKLKKQLEEAQVIIKQQQQEIERLTKQQGVKKITYCDCHDPRDMSPFPLCPKCGGKGYY